MVPYILVGIFAAFETEKLRRAILSGAGAVYNYLLFLERSIEPALSTPGWLNEFYDGARSGLRTTRCGRRTYLSPDLP